MRPTAAKHIAQGKHSETVFVFLSQRLSSFGKIKDQVSDENETNVSLFTERA